MFDKKQSLEQKTLQKQTASQQVIQFMRLLEMPSVLLEEEIMRIVDENPALEIEKETSSQDDIYSNNDEIFGNGKDPDIAEEVYSGNQHLSDDDYQDFFHQDDFDDDDYYREKGSDYELSNINSSKDDVVREFVIVNDCSLQEFLLEQLQVLDITQEEFIIASYIVGNIDNNGYLQIDNNTIANDLLFTYNVDTSPEKIEHIIVTYIQKLDPSGIGARNLKECLLIQLEKEEPDKSVLLAQNIIRNFFYEFAKKHYEKILVQISIDEEQLRNAIQVIQTLDPRPAQNQTSIEQASAYISPDFIISIENDRLVLTLNSQDIPKLRINKDFQNQYQFINSARSIKIRNDAEKFFKEHIDKAGVFINALSQRELTMYNIMYAIMQKQKAYFFSGSDIDLKPMILKDISEEVGVDISTVSRVTNNKYAQTPFGVIPLKHLFSESIGNEDTSSKEVKTIITSIIEKEDKTMPLTDEQICTLLMDKGYEIARRTVAKYREQLGFPVARLRKEL